MACPVRPPGPGLWCQLHRQWHPTDSLTLTLRRAPLTIRIPSPKRRRQGHPADELDIAATLAQLRLTPRRDPPHAPATTLTPQLEAFIFSPPDETDLMPTSMQWCSSF